MAQLSKSSYSVSKNSLKEGNLTNFNSTNNLKDLKLSQKLKKALWMKLKLKRKRKKRNPQKIKINNNNSKLKSLQNNPLINRNKMKSSLSQVSLKP